MQKVIKRLFSSHTLINSSLKKAHAERYLVKHIQDMRNAAIYGIRPKHKFREAVEKYLRENQHKTSIKDNTTHLRQLDPYIGDLLLDQVHISTLHPFVKAQHRGISCLS